jgi:hypothetical protein
MFLNNTAYIIKDIRYFSLFKVKYLFINNKLILNLNLLVLINKGDVIYKRVKIYKLNCLRSNRLFKGQSTLLKS